MSLIKPKSQKGNTELQVHTVRSGPGVRTYVRGGKCVVEVGRKRRSASAPRRYRAFDPILSSDNAGNPMVVFWPGMINGLLPGNYDEPQYLGTGEAVLYWKLFCSTDGKTVTTAWISSDSDPPAPFAATMGGAPSELQVCFAISVGTRVMRMHGHFSVTPVEVFRTQVATPVAWGLNYDAWYAWQINESEEAE